MDDTTVVLNRHKLDVDDFARMIGAGVLAKHDRVELIEGELIDMAPIGQDHAATVNGLTRLFVLACDDRAIVSVQSSMRVDRFNQPEPDLAVFRPRADNYRTGEPPQPSDVLLLVEVADSSLRVDRQVKLPIYARAGVAELWIVDLHRRVLDAYRDPIGDGYATTRTYGPGDRVALAQAPEISVLLDRVFD